MNKETKTCQNCKNDFIIEATFKFIFDEKYNQHEFCVVGRTGYNMGIFTQGKDAVKWCWFEDINGEKVYKDIFIYPVDNQKKMKIKVVKKGNTFTVYYNGELYSSIEITNLYDYSDQAIFIGVANPYSDNESNYFWFNGEIDEVKIYHDSVETEDNLYLWFNFVKNTQFKTFDKSGNGNHGEIYETREFKEMKNIEFNKLARPAKIV